MSRYRQVTVIFTIKPEGRCRHCGNSVLKNIQVTLNELVAEKPELSIREAKEFLTRINEERDEKLQEARVARKRIIDGQPAKRRNEEPNKERQTDSFEWIQSAKFLFYKFIDSLQLNSIVDRIALELFFAHARTKSWPSKSPRKYKSSPRSQLLEVNPLSRKIWSNHRGILQEMSI